MKSGKVELLDDTIIEDGSLLDITVVKTGTQVRAEAKEKKRNNSKQNAVVFSCMGKPKSADPLVVFQILPKSPRATLAFKDYEFQTHIVLDDVMSALVKHAIQISKPPASVKTLMTRTLRKRSQMAIGPGTKAAETARNDLFQAIEDQDIDDENQLAIWYLAAAAMTGDSLQLATLVKELPGYAAESAVYQQSSVGHALAEFRQDEIVRHEDKLRKILFQSVYHAIVRARRSLSGKSSDVKLQKKELAELKSRLEKEWPLD
jgi:hypothetical protein